MSTEELVNKVTETLVLSGTLILWDALDPVLEAQLTAVVGPVAPYLSAAICAVGYGVSSYYLQKLVPPIVKMLFTLKLGAQEAAQEMRLACNQLIALQERELRLLEELKDYAEGSFRFEAETLVHKSNLAQHQLIAPIDIKAMLANKL